VLILVAPVKQADPPVTLEQLGNQAVFKLIQPVNADVCICPHPSNNACYKLVQLVKALDPI
jgi:hypothetical protein